MKGYLQLYGIFSDRIEIAPGDFKNQLNQGIYNEYGKSLRLEGAVNIVYGNIVNGNIVFILTS